MKLKKCELCYIYVGKCLRKFPLLTYTDENN